MVMSFIRQICIARPGEHGWRKPQEAGAYLSQLANRLLVFALYPCQSLAIVRIVNKNADTYHVAHEQ